MLSFIKILYENIKGNRAVPGLGLPVLCISKDTRYSEPIYLDSYENKSGFKVCSDRGKGRIWIESVTDDHANTPKKLFGSANRMDSRIKRIHVNQNNLKHNLKISQLPGAKLRPLITMKCAGRAVYGDELIILGYASIIYSPEPLSCGANVWIETHADTYMKNPGVFDYQRVK
jgi:hypothetical protein